MHPGSQAAFDDNLAEILAHNADESQTFKKGVNQVRYLRVPARVPLARETDALRAPLRPSRTLAPDHARACLSQFTAMTKKEFKAWVGRGYNANGKQMAAARAAGTKADLSAHVPVAALPASLDWRTVTPPVVGPVKDQGGCGGCWAFSTAEAIESAVAIKTGKLFALSPQEVRSVPARLSCSQSPWADRRPS